MKHLTAVFLALLLSLPAAGPASATPVAYLGYVSGFQVATIVLDLTPPDDPDYRGSMQIDLAGILGWLSHWQGDLEAEGTGTGAVLHPRQYVTHWTDKGQPAEGRIVFDPATGLATTIWKGKPSERIGDDLRRGVLDPVSALLAIRQAVLDGRREPLSLPVYDGQRRFDLTVTLDPTARRRTILTRPFPVVEADVIFHPVDGFKPFLRDRWSHTTARVLFTADRQALPVRIMVVSPVGTGVMNLACAAEDSGPCPGAAGG